MNFTPKETRTKIAAHIPGALDVALESYKEFSSHEHNEDAKTFSAHHTACKAAIAHIQLLIKLSEMVEGDAHEEDIASLQESRKAAEEELKRILGGEE